MRYFLIKASLLFFLVLTLTTCKKEDVTPGFEMEYQQDFTIPPGIGPFVTHHFYLQNIFTRYEALLSQFGIADTTVVRILPLQASVTGIFGDANFNVVEEASLRIYEEIDPLGFIEAAYRFPTPIEPSNALDLIPTQADVKRIMSKDRFSIDLALRLRNTTPDDMPVRLSLKFKANY